jgi:metal transporter CNNM
MAKLLDRVLGVEEGGGLFRRAQLKALVDLHGTMAQHGGELTTDETTIISGALDMSHKTVAAVMTKLERVQGVALDTKLTWSALRGILACGHSRLPVHVPGDPTAIVGLLLVKELFAAVTLEDLLKAEAASEEGAAPVRTLLDAIKLRPIPRMNQVRIRGRMETALLLRGADARLLQATPLYTALNYFQTGRSHMAVVTAGATVLYLDSHSGVGAGAAAAAAAANGQVDSSSSTGLPRLVRSRSGGLAASSEASPPVAAGVPPAARRSLDAAAAAGTPTPLILGVGDTHMLAPAKGVVGILTLEDVLEELLQEEILDETDRAEGDEHVAAAENDEALQMHIASPPPGSPPPPPRERSPSPPLLPLSLLRRASGNDKSFERLESDNGIESGDNTPRRGSADQAV